MLLHPVDFGRYSAPNRQSNTDSLTTIRPFSPATPLESAPSYRVKRSDGAGFDESKPGTFHQQSTIDPLSTTDGTNCTNERFAFRIALATEIKDSQPR